MVAAVVARLVATNVRVVAARKPRVAAPTRVVAVRKLRVVALTRLVAVQRHRAVVQTRVVAVPKPPAAALILALRELAAVLRSLANVVFCDASRMRCVVLTAAAEKGTTAIVALACLATAMTIAAVIFSKARRWYRALRLPVAEEN